MKAVIIWIHFLLYHICWSREYGLLFKHDQSYLQTSYLTLCDNCGVKFEVLINRTAGVLVYAENRVRGVSFVLYFNRPGLYANVTDGSHKYTLTLTLDFFSNQWFGWHEIAIHISETSLQIMIDGKLRQRLLKGIFLFPEDAVEENEIYFGASPRWRSTKNVTGFDGFMKNMMYRSCGCEEWRPMRIINTVGVSLEHLGECSSAQSCPEDCTCHLFSWGSKRCDCPDSQCPGTSNDVSYDFDRNSNNRGRLHKVNRSDSISLESGLFRDGMDINEKSSTTLFVTNGRSCFKNIFLCENGFTHSFWLLPKITYQPDVPSMILKHSSTLRSTHGLTVTRLGNYIEVILITHEGVQYKVRSSLQLSIWSLVTIIYNKTDLSLYLNLYLKESSKRSLKVKHKFSELPSTRFIFIGRDKENPRVVMDNIGFTSNISLPNLMSIQELRLEQHRKLRKINLDCRMYVEEIFVDLTKCYNLVFRDHSFTEFYISLIINLQMEKSTLILVQSSFINITSESYNVITIDLQGQATVRAKLNVVASRLYYVEITINNHGKLVVLQNINSVLVNLTLNNYIWYDQKRLAKILVNKDSNSLSDVRFINVIREFATQALRIITEDVSPYSIDFDQINIENVESFQLVEGYIDQGLALKHPTHFISSDLFKGACLKYVASCYHGLTVSFWVKISNNFQNLNEHFFKIFSSGDNGISLILGKDGLYFLVIVESNSMTKFIPSPESFELAKWCLIEISVSPNGIASLFLNHHEAQKTVTPNILLQYKCSLVCLREENDRENAVTMVVDEMRIWNVEREFLYSNGYLSSDIQSLLQHQKNSENKIKKLKEENKSLEKDKKEMKEELTKMRIQLRKMKIEIKSSTCDKQLKDIDPKKSEPMNPLNETEKVNVTDSTSMSESGIKSTQNKNHIPQTKDKNKNQIQCLEGNSNISSEDERAFNDGGKETKIQTKKHILKGHNTKPSKKTFK